MIVLLAAKAGLRAGEIANLTWGMVLDPTGSISSLIELRDIAAKNGSGRLIPANPDLRHALAAYRTLSTGIGRSSVDDLSKAWISGRLLSFLYGAGATVARIVFWGLPGLPQITTTSVPGSLFSTSITQSDSIWRK